MIKILFSIILIFSSLFSTDFTFHKGWNLIGNGNGEIVVEKQPNVKRIFTYKNNSWQTFPKYKNYKSIDRIAPYSGFWALSSTDQKVNFRTLKKNSNELSLIKGWNLISTTGLSVSDLLANRDIKLLWSYINGKWFYATNDSNIESTIEKYGYEKFNGSDSANGLWAYSDKATLIKYNLYNNYFYGDKLERINKGVDKDIVVLGNNYPKNNYGYFLKNGNSIKSGDMIIKRDDNISFVPNDKVSLHFINLDNLVVDYMPLDTNLTESNNSFSIIMPKYSGFDIKVDSKEINGNSFSLNNIGLHNLDVSILDSNNNPIKNTMIFLDVNDSFKSRFDTLQSYTGDDGVAKFKYNIPSFNNESLRVKFYFFDGRLSKFSKGVTITTSNQAIDFLNSNLVINKPSQIYTIKGMIYDKKTNLPIKNSKLDISRILLKYGTIGSSSITSDDNGYFSFTYTSPDSLEDLNETNITVSNDFVSKSIKLTFQNSKTTSRVKKIVVDPSVYMVDGNNSKSIDIYTFDENNTPVSAPVTIGSLIVKKDGKYYLLGSIEPTTLITDENGKATVTYTPSNSIDALSGDSHPIKIYSDNNITAYFTINIAAKKDKVAKLLLSPNFIKVEDGLTQKIDILTLTNSNQPVSSTVNIPYPVDDNGQIFGSFDKYSVTTDTATGKVSVIYSAPSDMEKLNGEKNISISTSENGISSVLTFDFTKKSATSQAKIYKIKLTMPNALSVDNNGNIVVSIVENDNENNRINGDNVNDVNVTLLNKLTSFGNNGNNYTNDHNYTTEYKNSSTKSISLHAKHFSGIEVVNVRANIFDGEKNTTISKNFPLTISSGPVSSISMVYNNSVFDQPFYKDTYTLHAVDKYGNPAKEGTKIVVGAVAGVRKGGNGNFLKVDNNGVLSGINEDSSEFNVTDNRYDLSTAHGQYNNDEGSDTLIVLANEDRRSPLYLGGWLVDRVNSSKTLTLEGSFLNTKTKTDKLSFVIGNENRYDKCTDSLVVVDFDEPSKTYTLDSNGNANLVVKYDPFFVGHNIFLYANTYMAGGKRVGVSKRVILGSRNFIVVNDTTYGSAFYTYSNSDNTPHSSIEKINFSLKDNMLPLKDLYFDDNSFTTKGDCTIKVTNDNYTGCDGIIEANITTAPSKNCEIYWNGRIIQKDY